MKKEVFLIIVFLLFGLTGFCRAEDFKSLFGEANRLYKEGKYEEAKNAYEGLLNSGITGGSLYYNLGNAYVKLGKPGKAVVNYERAKFFIPQDSDLKANLNFVRAGLDNVISGKKSFLLLRVLRKIGEEIGFDSFTAVVCVIYAVVMILLGMSILFRWRDTFLRRAIGLCVLTLIIMAAAWLVRFYDLRLNRQAIIIARQTECKFAPSENATTYFKISEGAKVVVIGGNADWQRIKTADGKIGWIDKKLLEEI